MFTAECVRILRQTELTVIKLSVYMNYFLRHCLVCTVIACVPIIENLSFVVSFWINTGSKIVKKG